MGFFDYLKTRFKRSLFGQASEPIAAVAAPAGGGTSAPYAIPQPKVKPKQQSFPAYLTSTKTSDSVLPYQDRRIANTSIDALRTQAQGTRELVKSLVATSPDLSAAVFAYIRTAITPEYTAIAYNMDGTFNREATTLLKQLLVRFDVIQDYSDGFSGINALHSVSESLVKEFMQYGAGSIELVLGKDRLPRGLVPVSVVNVQFKQDDKWLKPVQVVGGDEIDLDQPTFFYTALDQDLTDVYASSPLEPAVQPVLFSADFQDDLRRIVKRAFHPRLASKINLEKFMEAVPPEIRQDPDKVREYMGQMVADLEGKLAGLEPEDAMVYFDLLDMSYMTGGSSNLDQEYKVLNSIIDAKTSTGAKALPSILGHGTGSQNMASVEAMLFVKSAEGVQQKLNELYSRALTLALRLFGLDVYVNFSYKRIDLRPDSELEAYRAMRQSRVLELLSLGFLTDEQAAIELTGELPPDGMAPLSGTRFRGGAAAPVNNPDNATAGQGINRSIRPGTPQQPKGPAKKAEIHVIGEGQC